MSAYVRYTLTEFIGLDVASVVGALQEAYALDGFVSQYTRQTKAWAQAVPKMQNSFRELVDTRTESAYWTILLEYPLYRLRRRIDAVILAESLIVLVECKVGAADWVAADRRQIEEYAFDLRDFHAESLGFRITPVLWSTEAPQFHYRDDEAHFWGGVSEVDSVIKVGREGLTTFLAALQLPKGKKCLDAKEWDESRYRPVPSVIEAATRIFAGHDVRSIANADADNLLLAASRLLTLIQEAKERKKRYLLILTGVPGSGKTLAGLDVVHSAVSNRAESSGDIVYLSGNTPLVVVLREALARDEYARGRESGDRVKLRDIRLRMRTRIQHINDFLKEGLKDSKGNAPHEHVIVFDEAQRAWDKKQGLEKFDRSASEPTLLLELMSFHEDWCACVCLVGVGQEINSGEDGLGGWGEALRQIGIEKQQEWSVFASPSAISLSSASTLGQLPPPLSVQEEPNLELGVSQRSYRSPSLSRWVDFVLSGSATDAQCEARLLGEYPLRITRSLEHAKAWLRDCGRGERRYGLIASSGARRLRADGLGVLLNAAAGDEIAQWYLNPQGDIRSSYALEVPANEYACQGLELDFACLCWGGDMLWSLQSQAWSISRLSGNAWQTVRVKDDRRFALNTYRVLMTRAREGLIFWIPQGAGSDHTRSPESLDITADFLLECGATILPIEA